MGSSIRVSNKPKQPNHQPTKMKLFVYLLALVSAEDPDLGRAFGNKPKFLNQKTPNKWNKAGYKENNFKQIQEAIDTFFPATYDHQGVRSHGRKMTQAMT